jgi:ABC-2 type transport system ATP-binding protein
VSHESPAILAESLTLSYGPQRGIFDFSICVDQGITALAGNNGAGKTTLLECLSGLRSPQSGVVRIYGGDPQRDRRQVTQILGASLQDVTPYPTAKPRDLLKFLASLYPHPTAPDSLLDQFSIPPTTVIKTLSAGQVQRLKCAMALIGNPKVVLLDEPTAGLDPGARSDLYSILRSSAEGGVVMIVATHLTEDIDALADRAIVLAHGQLAADIWKTDIGTAEQLEFRARRDLPLDQLLNALPSACSAVSLSHDRYLVQSSEGIDSSIVATVASWCAQHGTEATEISIGRNTLSQEVLRNLNLMNQGIAHD